MRWAWYALIFSAPLQKRQCFKAAAEVKFFASLLIKFLLLVTVCRPSSALHNSLPNQTHWQVLHSDTIRFPHSPFLGTCYTHEGNVPICGRPHRGYPVAKSRPGAAAPAIATTDPPLQHTPALAAWLRHQLAWSQSCTLPREAGAQC